MTELLRYKLVKTNHNSARYGNCEVCGKPVSQVYHQITEEFYRRSEDSTAALVQVQNVKVNLHWGIVQISNLFGHKECLESIQKKYKMNSGLGGVFTIKIVGVYDKDQNRLMVKVVNSNSEFDGNLYWPLASDIQEMR